MGKKLIYNPLSGEFDIVNTDNQELILVQSVDLLDEGTTTLLRVPLGKRFLATGMTVVTTSLSETIADPIIVSLGDNAADYDNIVDTTTLTGLTDQDQQATLYSKIGAKVCETYSTNTITGVSITDSEVVQVFSITFNSVPDAGSWSITYSGVDWNLDFDSTSAEIQTVLRGLVGNECPNLTVTGNYTDGFIITMAGPLVGIVAGSIMDVPGTHTLTTSGVPVVVTVLETVPFTPQEQTITFDFDPNFGTFKLGFNTEETVALNYDASASDVQAALRAITGLANVTVAAPDLTSFVVTFTGYATQSVLISPVLISVEDSTLSIIGWNDITFNCSHCPAIDTALADVTLYGYYLTI